MKDWMNCQCVAAMVDRVESRRKQPDNREYPMLQWPASFLCSKPMVLKVWYLDQQQQHHLENC
jgi:hypothetical protein